MSDTAAKDNTQVSSPRSRPRHLLKSASLTRCAMMKPVTKLPKFLRFLTILFVINFVASLLSLWVTSRDLINYDVSMLVDMANLVFEMVFLWLLWHRYKVARPFIIGVAIFNITVGVIARMIAGDFLTPEGIASQFGHSIFDIIMMLYFIFSKKTKACLTETFTFERNESVDEEFSVQRKGWPFIRNLIIYYCVFSLVGHWFEAGASQLMAMGIIQGEVDPTNTMLWRDWFYPFPMHGFAVVMIALILYPVWQYFLKKWKNPVPGFVISFVLNALVCGVIEFVMGLFVNANLQLWDYTPMPFNIMGQVCLQNVLGFGVVASIICWGVYPALEKLLSRVPINVMNVAFVAVVAAYAIPQALYLIDPPVDPETQLMNEIQSEYFSDEQKAEAQQKLDEYRAAVAEHERKTAEIIAARKGA